jgi:mRNA deadenylase 3'-5' endonuclease subunit Ccr4
MAAADFSVLQYNILADAYTRTHYSYVRPQDLNLQARLGKVLGVIMAENPTVITLQECDQWAYTNVLLPRLTTHGYDGCFALHTGRTEGVAVLWKRSTFRAQPVSFPLEVKLAGHPLVPITTHKVGLIVPLSRLVGGYWTTNPAVVIATTHLSGNPNTPDLPLYETQALLHYVSDFYKDAPLVFTGDLNIDPNSPTYNLITQDKYNPALLTTDTRGQVVRQPYRLTSAYVTAYRRDPEVTFATDKIHRCVDYIFYRDDRFRCVGARGLPRLRDLAAAGYMPNATEGSDHLALCASFTFL